MQDGEVLTALRGMRNVAAQLAGTGISLAMGTGTSPEERDKYLEMGFTLFQADAPS